MKHLLLAIFLFGCISCADDGDDGTLGDECGNLVDSNKIEICYITRKPTSEEAIFLKSYRSGSESINGWRVSIDDGATWHDITGNISDEEIFEIDDLPFSLKDSGKITVRLQDQHHADVDESELY